LAGGRSGVSHDQAIPDRLKDDALHRLMMKKMPGIVWSTDRELRVTAAFGSGLAALGLQPVEPVGRTLYELFQTQDETFPGIAAHLRALAGESASLEQAWRGRVYHMYVEPLRDHAGNIVGCIGLASDITERKQAEEALRQSREQLEQRVEQRTAELAVANEALQTIYDGMPDALLIADIETSRIVEANLSVCRMLGYSREELLALSVMDVHPAEDVPIVLENIRTHTEKELRSARDMRMLCKDGKVIPVDSTAARVIYGGRKCVVGFFRDVTHRMQTEEALRKEQRALRRLLESHERERKLVAYEIHDGLAQQLAAASMQLQAFQLSREQDPEEAAKALDAGMALLAQGLAETRRLISGLRPPILDDQGVVPAIEHLVREPGEPERPAVELVVNVRFGRLHPLLENAIFRIVQESLTNAKRHSQSDKVRVGLTQRGRRLHIEVRDWGVGFDPKAVGQRRFGLRGLRERARVLRGRVAIRSTPGKGTRLTAVLPLTVQ